MYPVSVMFIVTPAAQTGCWLHYRMLSKKHHFITSNLLFKSVFLWMNWHIISHFFGFVLTRLRGPTTEWYGSINFRSIKINKIILPSLVHWMISVRNMQAYRCLYKINERTCSDFFQESKLKIIWLGQHYFGHDSEKCVHTSDTSCPIVTRSPKIWVTESTLRIMSETGLVTIEMRSHLLFISWPSHVYVYGPSHLFLLRCERSLRHDHQ